MDTPVLDRRHFLTSAVAVAATAATVLGSTGAAAQQSENSSGSAKIIFVLFKRGDLTHEESVAEWIGPLHTGIVRKVPGLRRWVQNHPSMPPTGMADGIGELWFDSADAMARAMKSPEMAAAGEDAKRFLDMEKTYALVVSEKTIIP